MIPPLELRRLRQQGWRFTYLPESDQIRPTRPPNVSDEQALEARRLIQGNRPLIVRSLREDAAVDRLPPSNEMSSVDKDTVDYLAEQEDVRPLEQFVDCLVQSIQCGRVA